MVWPDSASPLIMPRSSSGKCKPRGILPLNQTYY